MAKIAWLASQEMIDFLNRYNLADRILLAKPGWHKKLCEINTLRKRLQAYSPDLCIDLHGDVVSGLAARLSGSGKRIALNGPTGLFFRHSKGLLQSGHQMQKRLKLLEMLKIRGASVDYDLPEIPCERHTVNWIARELGLESTPFAMVGVGVQSNSTHWEIDRYVQVAEHLRCSHRLPALIAWQGDLEKRIAERIVAESGGMAALLPALSAVQFIALARRASIYIGADNDFLHIAAAVGTPCIGVFDKMNSCFDAPYCKHFQWVQMQLTEPRRNGRGVRSGASPVRIDNYTYDVIQVCNACDDILQPESVQKTLSDKHPVGV